MTATSPPAFSRCVDVGGANIRVESRHATTVVAVTGEIDALNAVFTATVLDGFAAGTDPVVVDVSDLGFIGIQGLRMLVDFDDGCQRNGVVWGLVPCGMLSRLLQVVDIGRQLPVWDSVDAAIQQLKPDAPLPIKREMSRVALEKLRC